MLFKTTRAKLDMRNPEVKRALLIGGLVGYCLGLAMPHLITLTNTATSALASLLAGT